MKTGLERMAVRVLLGMVFLASAETSTRAGDAFVVVVHGTNPAMSLSRSELKKIVTGGTRQWDNGAAVQVGIIPVAAPETLYLGSLIDLSVPEFLSRLQEQVFKGEMRRPAVLHGTADCIAFAHGSPGAICVSSITNLPSDVHAVSIH